MGNITIVSGKKPVTISGSKTLSVPGPFAGGATPTSNPTISGPLTCESINDSFCILGNITNNDSETAFIDVDKLSNFSSPTDYRVTSGQTREFTICGFSNPPGNVTIYARATTLGGTKPTSGTVSISQNVTSCLIKTAMPTIFSLFCNETCVEGDITNNDTVTATIQVSQNSNFSSFQSYTLAAGSFATFSFCAYPNPPGNVTIYARATATGKQVSDTFSITQNIRFCAIDGGGGIGFPTDPEPEPTYSWVYIDWSTSPWSADYSINTQAQSTNEGMAAEIETLYPANSNQGLYVSYFSGSGYYVLFYSTT